MIKFNIYEKGGTPVIPLKVGEVHESPAFKWAKEREGFNGEFKQISYVGDLSGRSMIFIGLGQVENLTNDDIRYLFFELAKVLREKNEREIEVVMPDLNRCNRQVIMAVYEGLRQAEYSYTNKKDLEEKTFDITVNYTADHGPEERLSQGLRRSENIMDGVFLARDLVNLTANELYPESLANKVEDIFSDIDNVKVRVFSEEEIRDIGMEAFLAVSKGSYREPKFIIIEYKGDKSTDFTTGLVGKGITYDSGGYCIKPPSSMLTMHSDMAGAASVIGTIYSLAKSKSSENVTGVIAACENMVSGKAYKTGDIIPSLSGKTIEIVNTDAEGRVTLADAVYYITDVLKVDRLIDLATLTGACVSALGEDYTAAITNDQDFLDDFIEASDMMGEKVWQLPADEEFTRLNYSDIADIKNSGGRKAGTITAGLFVGDFLADPNIPWIHLDIAGTAYRDEAYRYLPKRATGYCVKSLYNFLDKIESC